MLIQVLLNKLITISIRILLIVLFFSCNTHKKKSDAYGNFEAKEILVSSESAGRLLKFTIEEGVLIDSNKLVGNIDSTQLQLKRNQILAMKSGINSKTKNIYAQINVLKEQKKNLQREKNRLEKLIKDGAATSRQLDEINGNLQVLDRQVESIEVQNAPILSEIKNIDAQLDQIHDLIKKCTVYNPARGTVITKFAEESEIVAPGKPLYKLALLEKMFLRAYISGDQLPHIKIGQEVDVLIDENTSTNRSLKGVVSWISSSSEFTPKIIQTKDERVNLVYAIKIKVINDGTIKTGMPGEVNFRP